MNEQLIAEGNDALLAPFLQERNSAVAEDLLAGLIENHADPIIAKILKSKLRVSLNGSQGNQANQDALEIASDLRATLIAEIRRVQQRPLKKSIKSFPDYVAVKAYSACADYFREKHPQRWRLKNLLRYQLKQNESFALWKAEDNRWYAGLKQWAGTTSVSDSLPSCAFIRESSHGKHDGTIEPDELLNTIFAQVGHPVEFERIVTLASEVWNITDSPLESTDDSKLEAAINSVDSTPRVDLALEQRLYVEKLWEEVGELPVLQRAALLLNLRDAQGGSAIFFIPHLEIASQKQIAEMIEIPAKEFSEIWNALPLDDSRIAGMFGLTRQQVINLRKTARERLARRMEKSEAKGTKAPVDGKKGNRFTA